LVVRVCGSDAGSRGRGRKFSVAARKIPKRLDDAGDGAESGGATQGSSRRGELASVVGRPGTSGRLVPLVRYLGIHRAVDD
jgi:hypothetical protein